MDLSKFTFFAFQEKRRQIHDLLADDNNFKDVLDEARRELPIIDGLLGLLGEVKSLPEDKQDAVITRIIQDVHIVLTLWRLVHPACETGQGVNPAPTPTSDDHLRLRQFGMN